MRNLLLGVLAFGALNPVIAQKQTPVTVKEVQQMIREKFDKRISLNPEIPFKTYENDPINVKQYTLSNGLTVLLSENHDVPQVYGMVVVKAGGKNDPADATGIAHYLEHMLFKGTTTMGTIDYQKEKPYLDKINDLYEELGKTTDEEVRKKIQKQINEQSVKAGEYAIANEIDKLLSQIGGTGVNAFTTEDYTAYHNTFPANQMDRWLEVYSHRFEKPVFRLFQSELETVYEEKNRSMDDFSSALFEKFMKSFYKKHPYGQQTIIGKTEHLKNPPLKKMYQYYEDHYVANNMALILAGDFKSELVLPIIKQKFGDWRKGEVPGFGEHKEESFDGREFHQVKMTPVKAGVIGFRAPKNNHPDRAVADVSANLLSNFRQSGLIDKVVIDGDMMFAGVMNLNFNDYSTAMMIFVPKIVGQKLEAAEEIIMSKLEMLKKGEFDKDLMEAVQLNLKNDFARQWENNNSRIYALADCFAQGREWGNYLQYEKQLERVTSEDVIRFANEYYGDNYLCFYSKMGFPKKEKLEKPGYEPVIPKNEVKSKFRERFEKIPASQPNPRYVNFEKDITTLQLQDKVTLKYTRNPFNQFFSMDIHYGIGRYHVPDLMMTALYLDLIGTENMTANEFKEAFYKLGCTYSFRVSEERFSIHLNGMEQNLPKALKLMKDFCQNAKVDEKKVKKLLDDFKGNNKLERRTPDFIAQALEAYALYGDSSSHRRELTKKELKKLTGKQLIGAFNKAQGYEVIVHYTGQQNPQEVKNLLTVNYHFNKDLQPKTPKVVLNRILPKENTVYALHKKKAVQSQLNFLMEGSALQLADMPKADAFNAYFGGNMSSIVFQEIREFRSLAYSTRARYYKASLPGKNNYFRGYIGCQGDKTGDALEAMTGLIRNMPQKQERTEPIKSALRERAQSNRPRFRSLISTVEKWQQMGYTEDPNKAKAFEYGRLTFNDINGFHAQEIKEKPLTITVVGNKKRFDFNLLKSYGKVLKVKEKDLFVN